MKSREEASDYAWELMNTDQAFRKQYKGDMKFHFGSVELRMLMDFIYEGPPTKAEEEIPAGRSERWGKKKQVEAPVPEHSLYVQPYGDDSNDGSKDLPFKTVERAIAEAEKLNPDKVTIYMPALLDLTPGATVYFPEQNLDTGASQNAKTAEDGR